VLRSATSNAAQMIGTTDRGLLEPGKLADVAVFNGDPTRDIALMERQPAMVLIGGQKIEIGRLPA
jgi:imidazolonepropionase-like amidohydrolase